MYWCVNSSSKLVSFWSWKLIPDYCSIGYPVVTLGFGFKSYVGYRMKQRRQKEIQKENETYYSLLREVRSECSWWSVFEQVGTWLNWSYKNYINLNTSVVFLLLACNRMWIYKSVITWLSSQALPPGPARDDAFNPQPSPKPGLEERISVKEGAPGPGLPLPIANGGPGDNLVDKCNRFVSR